MFMRSERLFLRPRWPEDRDELLELAAGDWVAREVAGLDWLRETQGAQFGVNGGRFPHFVVTAPGIAGSSPVGGIGFDPHSRGAELAFWIVDGHRGQGFATEAVRALLPLAAMLGHKRLVAAPYADDAASMRVLAKAGFAATGDSRVRFSKGLGVERVTAIHEIALDGSASGGGLLAA
ncbi:MAG: GNAT family protein [Sphingomonadaceae bacterium]